MFRKLCSALFDFFGSYGLAIVVLLFLFVLTFLGTIEQTRVGLYEVQQKYFTSLFLVHDFGRVAIPLPGVYLLSVIFCINLVVGGILRMLRKRPSPGLYIVHGGILFMLLGGVITHHFAVEGAMALAPNQTANVFESYHNWELAIVDTSHPDKNIEYLIPQEDFSSARDGRTVDFRAEGLPFEIALENYSRNARVLPKGPMFDAPNEVVGGFFVLEQPLEKENERNTPAVYVSLLDKATGEMRKEILWGQPVEPLAVKFGDRTFNLYLRRVTWPLPFSITLKEFTREFHPGTQIARTYESDVVKTESNQTQDITIRMNEPLRHRGYTFFQASFIENADPAKMASVFAVVRNPADQFPLYACIIVTIGLIMHFGWRLSLYLKRERESRA